MKSLRGESVPVVSSRVMFSTLISAGQPENRSELLLPIVFPVRERRAHGQQMQFFRVQLRGKRFEIRPRGNPVIFPEMRLTFLREDKIDQEFAGVRVIRSGGERAEGALDHEGLGVLKL